VTDLIERLAVYQGDITRLEVGAIVNAANTRLAGGGGVDGAIHMAAGPELLAACRKIGGCPTGEARLTAGYRLPADWVIHTVGPVYRGVPADSQMLTACYQNSLALAAQKEVGTVAFPAISCGVYGYPIEKAARIAIETTLSYLQDHRFPEKVMFVLFSEKDATVYRDCLSETAA